MEFMKKTLLNSLSKHKVIKTVLSSFKKVLDSHCLDKYREL